MLGRLLYSYYRPKENVRELNYGKYYYCFTKKRDKWKKKSKKKQVITYIQNI